MMTTSNVTQNDSNERSDTFHRSQQWQGVVVIDCSDEQSRIHTVAGGPLVWLADDINVGDWQIPLSKTALQEINAAALHIERNPVQQFQRSEQEIDWPATRQCLLKLRHQLIDGPGFAVLKGFEPDHYPADVALELYWLLGQCIGKPVAQKWNGEMIYSVRDTGQRYGYGVRGSRTSVELVFHVDNAFGLAVPDFVGLYCVRPAKTGGISRFCSLYTVHEQLRTLDYQALQRLYEPMLFDRQKEHHPDAPAVLLAPFFSWRHDRLFARANTSLVHKGYQVAGIEMDDALKNALQRVNEICAQSQLWFEAPLQRGDIQYLNNHEVGHYRSAFTDHENPDHKRHLYRLWHRNSGPVAYDGANALQ